MWKSGPGRLASAHAKWLAFAAAMIVFGVSAAPASAIMVKLPHGGYANYDALSGAKAPKAARNFDAIFTNLDYSGGPVMHSNANSVVEWSPSNYPGADPGFQPADAAGHVDYVTGVGNFLSDLAAASHSTSVVDSVSGQYNDATGTAAFSATYGGVLVDNDPLPANGCPAATGDICITDAQIQTELDHFLSAHGKAADLAHEYFLLTPPAVASCFDAAGTVCSANADVSPAFCAYHSRTSSGGYVYSNIPDLAGVFGCDPFVTDGFSYDNGPGDGMLSAVSHEHNESITDPEPNNAWTDWGSSVGGEIGDKCNFDADQDPNTQFGTTFDNPFNQVINGRDYWIQREWSNQTKKCLGGFSPSATTALASFTQTPSPDTTMSFNAAASTSSPGGVAEYVWQFNDGPGQNTTIERSTPTISHTFPSVGTYVVALTVMNADGTSQGTAHLVTVGQSAPTAAFTPSNGGENAPITFSGLGSTDPNPGGTLSYAWNFGDGTTAGGSVVSHAFRAGAYTVSLTVTDSASGLTNSVSHPVFILDEGSSAAFNPPSGTATRSVAFTGFGSDPDGSITSYSWSFGDGGTGSGASVSHTYTSPGSYAVTLRVTDSSGQSASVSHTVSISPLPVRCVVPRLKGDSLSKARAAVKASHCSLGKVTSPKKPSRGAGNHKKWVLVVASQSPSAGSIKPQGAKVALRMTWKAVHK